MGKFAFAPNKTMNFVALLIPVLQSFENLITALTLKKLVLFVIFILLLVVFFILYEWQTSTIELTRYERSTQILKDIDLLISSENEEISNSAKDINRRLQSVISKEYIISYLERLTSPRWVQVFFAILPWIIIAIILVSTAVKKGEESRHMAIGYLIIILLIGSITYFIPPDWNKFFRYGGPQLFNLILFIVLAWIGLKVIKKQ